MFSIVVFYLILYLRSGRFVFVFVSVFVDNLEGGGEWGSCLKYLLISCGNGFWGSGGGGCCCCCCLE